MTAPGMIPTDVDASYCYEIARYTRIRGGAPSTTELADWCDVHAGNCVKRVERLCALGYVTREADTRPRRTPRGLPPRVLVLTELGASVGATAAPVINDPNQPPADRMTVPQRASDRHSNRRLAIVRAVVSEMGVSEDSDSVDRCPVIQEVQRRWYVEEVGAMDWTLEEVGVAIGVSRERVRQIQDVALRRMRQGLSRHRAAIVDALHGRDAMPEHWSCEAVA